MKTTVVLLLAWASSVTFAQSDSMFVVRIEGNPIASAVSDIKKISFSSIPPGAPEQGDSMHIVLLDETSISYAVSLIAEISFSSIPPGASAKSDSMHVMMLDGKSNGYAVSDIKEMSFVTMATSVREQEGVIPSFSSFKLHQNYPNPFNPTTTIEYEIPSRGEVEISIYDIQGRLVHQFTSGYQEAGLHTSVWYGRDVHGTVVPAGSYFCSVRFEKSHLVNRLLLIK